MTTNEYENLLGYAFNAVLEEFDLVIAQRIENKWRDVYEFYRGSSEVGEAYVERDRHGIYRVVASWTDEDGELFKIDREIEIISVESYVESVD